jgi:NAD(P)H-flavin reductase
MTISDKLPVEIINVITTADTVFLASYYHPTDLVRDPTASHAGMNIRAGLPGFIRVDPCNNRTVIIPDYSGNRFMTSLGNISSTSMAGLTIVDFHTGNVLYLTGRAQVLIGPSAMKIMPRQTCVTAIEITGYILVHDALPVRQEPGTITERSPYSPKVKYLVSEPEGSSIESGTGLRAQLSQTIQYAHDIATFRFTVFSPRPGPTGLRILPGQAIVLDFMDWMGPPVYMHMANDTPSSINDDRVRTWTVSSGHEGQDVTWFDLTMREVKQGAVTGALFKILRQNSHGKTKEVLNLSGTNVYADIVGITGDFNIRNNDLQMLWVAGGIGVTPFMAMLAAISQREKCTKAIITLALATREPKVFLDLIKTSFPKALTNVQIKVDVFSSQGGEMPNDPSNLLDSKWVDVTFHNYRIPNDYWSRTRDYDEVFICGPAEFGDVAQNRLKEAGIPDDRIHREGFY